MKKLFDSGELGELGPAKHSYRGRPSCTSASCFGRRGRENRRQPTPTILSLRKPLNELSILTAPNQVNPVFYQPLKSIRVASEILKMNPTLRYFLSLTLKLAAISSTHLARNAKAVTARER